MESAPFATGIDNILGKRRHAFRIDAELAGAPAHLHTRTAQIEIGIDPDGKPRRPADLFGNGQRTVRFSLTLQIERHACADSRFQLFVGLARPGEADFRRVASCGHYHGKLPRRSYVEPIRKARHRLKNGPEAVGFDGIMDMNAFRKSLAERGHPGFHHRTRINEERGLARIPDQLAHGASVDGQFAIDCGETFGDRAEGFGLIVH